MATIQATNVLSGSTEGAKYNATGITSEIWSAATTTSLASGDIISAMTLPANTYVTGGQISWTDVDSATSFAWKAGVSGDDAAFVATGNTTGQSAGVQAFNVMTSLGYTATSDKTVIVTITATAGTPVAGTCRIVLNYTASP